MRALVAMVTVLVTAGLAASCKQGPELTCRANEQCFVCPDEKSQAACMRDPSSARRCKWKEPGHCKK